MWVQFFALLARQGHAGVFVNAILSLLVGSIIVAFHNTWSGIPAILTFIGWAQVVKGAISLVAPAVGMKGLRRVSGERAWEIQVGGGIFLLVSAAIAALARLTADLVELRFRADVERVPRDCG